MSPSQRRAKPHVVQSCLCSGQGPWGQTQCPEASNKLSSRGEGQEALSSRDQCCVRRGAPFPWREREERRETERDRESRIKQAEELTSLQDHVPAHCSGCVTLQEHKGSHPAGAPQPQQQRSPHGHPALRTVLAPVPRLSLHIAHGRVFHRAFPLFLLFLLT